MTIVHNSAIIGPPFNCILSLDFVDLYSLGVIFIHIIDVNLPAVYDPLQVFQWFVIGADDF
jgi:hypothetical protein